MKLKSIFALLILTLTFSACNDKETVSGDMKYNKAYVTTHYETFIPSGPNCKTLLDLLESHLKAQKAQYNREWSVSFSGTSVDSALAKADQEAVADFDTAVANLKALKKQVDETIAKDGNGIGKGSFSITYVVRVWRDKVLKESEPIVFEYEYQQ